MKNGMAFHIGCFDFQVVNSTIEGREVYEKESRLWPALAIIDM